MTLTEMAKMFLQAALVVALIVLVFWLASAVVQHNQATSTGGARAAAGNDSCGVYGGASGGASGGACNAPSRGQIVDAAIAKRGLNYDALAQQSMGENSEFFSTCADPDEVKKVTDCVCAGQDSFAFAENEYGAKGLDYKSYVTSQAVGDDVIRNHTQYLADKAQTEGTAGSFLTGRTMSPDSHDSYDPIPWQGLRRPQYVETCNPTQVPDVDTSLYKGNRQFCFN